MPRIIREEDFINEGAKMDPNITIREIRAIIASWKLLEKEGGGVDLTEVDKLVEYIDALDTWILKGGYLPEDWQKARNEGQKAVVRFW